MGYDLLSFCKFLYVKGQYRDDHTEYPINNLRMGKKDVILKSTY